MQPMTVSNAANANATKMKFFFTMNGGTLNVEVGEAIPIQLIRMEISLLPEEPLN